jgi:hypothetical protein
VNHRPRTYDLKDAGARTVTAALAGGDFTANGGTLLSNYVLPTTATGAAQIDQAVLTAAIVGLPTKTYDATTAASLTSANYGLSGFAAGEGATVTTPTASTPRPTSAIRTSRPPWLAATSRPIPARCCPTMSCPPAPAAPGSSTKAPLTPASLMTRPRPMTATVAALTSANYAFSGFIAGQSGTITETTGVYDSANAGARTVTATFGSSDFTAGGGTLLTNYLLPTTASGAGHITQATLTAAIIGNPTKLYDGTTSATLTSATTSLLGFVAGEGADRHRDGRDLCFAQCRAAHRHRSLGSSDFTATGATLLSNYVLPTTAAGIGQINQAQLVATLSGVSKTYDGTTAPRWRPATTS